LIMALVFFTASNVALYRRIGGVVHSLAHLSAIFVLGWFGFLLMRSVVGAANYNDPNFHTNHLTYINLIWFASLWLVCGVGGYFIGSIIMGVYLFVSLHIFGRHDNEAFSALKIQDYKNFLRMHIDEAGNLTIYPIKIEKVARRWDYVERDGNDFFQPSVPLKPELIEDRPVII